MAVAIYKTFYEDAINRIESIENAALSEKSAVEQMLTVYFQSYCMARKEIFNKYSLNDGIRLLAQDNHGKIGLLIENKLPQSDKDALMIIIDGSLKELCERKEYEKKVIAGLVKLLC